MELRIEKILRELGYNPSVPCGKEWKGYYSSIGIVFRKWNKEGVKKEFYTGLEVVGYPPNLINPIPNHINHYDYPAKVAEWIQKLTDDEIKTWIKSFN